MTHMFKLARRTARFRALAFAGSLLVFGACNPTDQLSPSEPTVPVTTADTPVEVVSLDGPELYTGKNAPGIAFGAFNLPTYLYNSTHTGAVKAAGPLDILSTLYAARSKGARVVVRMSGSDKYFQNSDGTFSFSKWKYRIDRFRKVNLKPYIDDGTLIGHYILDEPYDPTNWGGKTISPSTVEAMAKYSKSIWPSLATIVRAPATWANSSSIKYTYLDATWNQYVMRKGDLNKWLYNNVTAAKAKGLAMVVGINMLNGGTYGRQVTASQLKSWGATLASHPYSCAFLSWQYNSNYFSRSDIKDALKYVGYKAKNHAWKSCRS
jgi:hypothetical protein